MSDTLTPLDLVITLTPPPDGAPPDVLAQIGLSCPILGSSLVGDTLRDPLTPDERAELRWYLETYWRWPFDEFAQRGSRAERLLADVGARLYAAVFSSPDARDVLQDWRRDASEAPRQISIVSHVPAALALPWELLHDAQGFLALRSVSIIRRLPQKEPPAGSKKAFTPPLRVLLVTARPDDAGFIDQRAIAKELLDEVQAQVAEGRLDVELLRPPTLAALQRRLRDKARPVHILHFDGHGVFDAGAVGAHEQLLSDGQQGQLAFEDDNGKIELVPADMLANVLQVGGVRLAVLTACQSAVGAADDAFSSVAGRLIKGGVDAVVAMGASVLVVAAARYVEAFYRELARGEPAPAAHELARQALYSNTNRHVFQRERDKPGQPVKLQDWWLPQLYQQRPLQLAPAQEYTPQPVAPPQFSGFPEGFPALRARSFFGRARELLLVERTLRRGKVMVIHGFGGMGKTALAHEAADWLTRTGMYRGACFVSFEHGGDAATLLHALGSYLGILDSGFDHTNIRAALAQLRPALAQLPTLIIADNLESIMLGGDAPLPPDERTKLWDVLLALGTSTQPASSALRPSSVVLTTRTPTLGDGRLEPGRFAAHLPLRGLLPDDGYDLASALLDDMQIERAHAPYRELRDLLAKLDQHPLAIHLVLPALREHALEEIREDFAALLPQFEDDYASGRNRSLLASLEYSLRRLSDAQRALLVRLAPFESGASEDDLLAITEIAEAAWAALRPALEQAALLTAERAANYTAPFLRFHPVLAPYLRGRPGADDPALQARYTERYQGLARYLYHEDNRNPQAVRALVWRELPNLRRALALLAAQGDAEALAEMVDSISRFLGVFGLLRERAELQALMERVAASGDGALTWAEYLRETNAGEAEYASGDIRSAYTRFSAQLLRIEAQPAGAPLGQGSYEHCQTLHRLARCLRVGGQPAAAEDGLRTALAIVEALIAQQPDNQSRIRQRGALLTDLGDVLTDQGKYAAAQAMYEVALEVATQGKDARQQGVVLIQFGTLALRQREYTESHKSYREALALFQTLDEPAIEAVAWHQLGIVAQEQREWAAAEDAYRRSAEIKVRLGNMAGEGAAATYNQLAIVAQGAGHFAEAEGWLRRALEIYERFNDQQKAAVCLNNLANLLMDEAHAGNTARLAEARSYSERALAIRETLDASSEIWGTLSILASIAALEGRDEAAREYRRRERETFAAFAGNRWQIDQQHGDLIAVIAAAAQGDAQARAAVEAALPQLETNGWQIADATRRIWAGERDWGALVEELDRQDALLVLRVLEELGG
jgi:tetratricopeptide (TPR) repeat protein